MEAHMSEVLGG